MQGPSNSEPITRDSVISSLNKSVQNSDETNNNRTRRSVNVSNNSRTVSPTKKQMELKQVIPQQSRQSMEKQSTSHDNTSRPENNTLKKTRVVNEGTTNV